MFKLFSSSFLVLGLALNSVSAVAADNTFSVSGSLASSIFNVLEVAGAMRVHYKNTVEHHARSVSCTVGIAAPTGPGNYCSIELADGQISEFGEAAAVRTFEILKKMGATVQQGREGQMIKVNHLSAAYTEMHGRSGERVGSLKFTAQADIE